MVCAWWRRQQCDVCSRRRGEQCDVCARRREQQCDVCLMCVPGGEDSGVLGSGERLHQHSPAVAGQ